MTWRVRPWPAALVNVAAFYTAAVTWCVQDHLRKEAYWERLPGRSVPAATPIGYLGPWKGREIDWIRDDERAAAAAAAAAAGLEQLGDGDE